MIFKNLASLLIIGLLFVTGCTNNKKSLLLSEQSTKTSSTSLNDSLEHKLFEAVNSSNIAVVRELINKGANTNATNKDGSSVLFEAIAKENKQIIELLIKSNANVNGAYHGELTPLMWAAIRGATEIVDLLIKAGADVNVKTISGRSAVITAILRGKIDSIRDLLLSMVPTLTSKIIMALRP